MPDSQMCGPRGGGGAISIRLIISCFTITEKQICQNRRTGPFTDYRSINPKHIGRLYAMLLQTNAINHQGGPVTEAFDDAAFWPCGCQRVSAWS